MLRYQAPSLPSSAMDSPGASEQLLANLRAIAPFLDADYRHMHADLALFQSLAAETRGPVLEPGCGTGRVLAALCQCHMPCLGLDISPDMLARAAARLRAANSHVRPELVCADMSDFDLPQKDFGLAILASNTLMHLAGPQLQMATLQCIHRHLRPGGYLVLDLFNPPVTELVLQDRQLWTVDSWTGSQAGSRVTKWMQREVDWIRQIQRTRIIFETLYADDRLEQVECTFNLHFLWKHETELMLAQTGFHLRHVWGSYRRGPLQADSEVMVFLAAKAGQSFAPQS